MSLSTPPAGAQPTSPPFAWIEWLAIPALYSLMVGGVYALCYALLLTVAGAGGIAPFGGFIIALTLLVLVWLALLLDDWATGIAPESLLVAAPRVVNGSLAVLLVVGAFVLTLVTGFSYFPFAGASSDITTLLAFMNAILIGLLYYAAHGYPRARREQAFSGGYGVHAWLLRTFGATLAGSVLVLFLGVLQPQPGAFFSVALLSLPISVLSGVLALALARLLTVARAPTPPSEPRAEVMRSWYPFVRNFGVAAVLALVVVELLAVTGLLNLLLTLLNPLWVALEGLVGGALAGLAQLLAPLARFFTLPQTQRPPQQTGAGKQTAPQPAPASHSGPPPAPHSNVLVISPLALTLIVLGVILFLILCFVIPWLRRRRRLRRGQPISRVPWFVPGIVATVATLLLLALLLLPPLLNPNPQTVAIRVVLPISLPVVGSQLQYGASANGSGNGQGQGGGQGGSSSRQQPSGGSSPANTPGKKSGANSAPSIPPWLIEAVTIGLLVALAVLALGIGVAIWRSRRKRKQDDDEGVYEIAHERPPQPAPVDPFQGDAARVYYRQLLRAAERAGGVWARRPTETPVEYETRLRELLATTTLRDLAESGQTPEAVAALADLTTAYRVARYKGDATDKQRSERLRGRLPRLLGALGNRPSA